MRIFAAIQLLLLSALASAAAERPSAAATVARLYHDYAWEAVVEDTGNSGVGLMEASSATLSQYFDPVLTALIVKDRECAERTHEICRLDFLPIWDSQDPGAMGLTVNPTDDPSVVRVRFTYPGNQKQVELTYTLKKSAVGWRITNITGSNWSLLNVLGGKQ